MVRYELPFPPTTNHYWRHQVVKGKARIFLGADGKAYRAHVGYLTKPLELAGRLSVIITVQAPDKRRYDIDNRLKPVLDALTAARVWNDDSQVDQLTIIRLKPDKSLPEGRCTVTISEVIE